MRIGQHYYTWCPENKGCEGITGYQTRAKSPWITPDVERVIKRYCTNYRVPRSLAHLENKPGELSSADLCAAPVAIHFYPVLADRVALTRVGLHPKPGRQPGIHFAHTLVFSLDDICSVDFNPFAVVNSGLVATEDSEASSRLDDLEVEMTKAVTGRLERCRAVDEKLVRDLVSSLAAPTKSRRPVVICVSNGQDGSSIIEAALMLLPPLYRCSMSFSSYEPDPYRVLTEVDGCRKPTARLIGTIAQEEGGRFEFSQDAYQSRYYVFNLCEGRQSEAPSPSLFIERICDSIYRQGVEHEVLGLHAIVEGLGIGLEVEIWNAAMPAAYLVTDDRQASPQQWSEAVKAVSAICVTPDRAARGLGLLWKALANAPPGLPLGTVNSTTAACRNLLDRASDRDKFLGRASSEMTSVFTQMLLIGAHDSALQLLSMAGEAKSDLRRRIVMEGTADAKRKGWPKSGIMTGLNKTAAADFVDVLVEAFEAASRSRGQTLLAVELAFLGMAAASDKDSFSQMWRRLGGPLMSIDTPGIGEGKMESSRDAACANFSKLGEAEQEWQFLMWCLKRVPPSGQTTDRLFSRMGSVSRMCHEPTKAVEGALAAARSTLKEDDEILLIVKLYDEGGSEANKVVAKDYEQVIRLKGNESTQWDIRRKVAQLGGGALLGRECAMRLLQLQGAEQEAWLGAWISEIFGQYPTAARQIVARICDVASDDGMSRLPNPIIPALLRELRKAGVKDEGLRGVVAGSQVRAVPLDLNAWKVIGGLINGLDTTVWETSVRARIDLAKCMDKAAVIHGTARPRIDQMAESCPDLCQVVANLDEIDWRRACGWVLSGLAGEFMSDRSTIRETLRILVGPNVTLTPSSTEKGNGPPLAQARGERATDMIASHLLSELVDGKYRGVYARHACCLAEFVRANQEMIKNGYLSRQLSLRIIGPVLTKDDPLAEQLLWPYLSSFDDIDFRWVDELKKDFLNRNRNPAPRLQAVPDVTGPPKRASNWKGGPQLGWPKQVRKDK